MVKERIKRSGRRGRGDPPVATSVSLGKKLCPVLTNSRKLSVPTIVIVYTLPNDIANAIDTAPPHQSVAILTVDREEKDPPRVFGLAAKPMIIVSATRAGAQPVMSATPITRLTILHHKTRRSPVRL